MADRFGYLHRFVLSKDGSTVYLHRPEDGVYNRHYVMESTRYRIRAQETADNIFIDMDYGNRSPVEQRRIDQEVFVQKASLTALQAYLDALENANGWCGTLYKMNALGTVTMSAAAKLEHIEYLEPARKAARQCVFKVTFFIFGKGWSG
jgi:hypothetical protein